MSFLITAKTVRLTFSVCPGLCMEKGIMVSLKSGEKKKFYSQIFGTTDEGQGAEGIFLERASTNEGSRPKNVLVILGDSIKANQTFSWIFT